MSFSVLFSLLRYSDAQVSVTGQANAKDWRAKCRLRPSQRHVVMGEARSQGHDLQHVRVKRRNKDGPNYEQPPSQNAIFD